MDPIKQAFDKIKQEIFSLKQEVQTIKQTINHLKYPKTNQTLSSPKPNTPLRNLDKPTDNQTIRQSIEASKTPNMTFSIGNGGVQTDKPTDRQTNQQTDIYTENFQKQEETNSFRDFENAQKILESLDSLKKEIRLKFKRLTPQEMSVFSTIYSFEEQNIPEITYKIVSEKLKLTESSIRDYVNKLIKKGIPILKIRHNNKKITLSISSNLKGIASLNTILKLRDL